MSEDRLYMTGEEIIKEISSEFSQAIHLAKCRKCGCMREVLEPLLAAPLPPDFFIIVDTSRSGMEPSEYHCLGCEHCYPAVIMNLLHQAFPEHSALFSLACAWEEPVADWPPIPGDYFVLGQGALYPVAVSTLASPELAADLAKMKPPGLCIIGKTETENIGIDKIIKNTISNLAIKFLLLVGPDADGHCSGKTLLALSAHGVDDNLRVIGSPGRRPVLANVTPQEVAAFRRQVSVVDLIGCQDHDAILARIKELAQQNVPLCTCTGCGPAALPPLPKGPEAPVILATPTGGKKLDPAGYLVIITQPHRNNLVVEHYSYDNRLLRVIEGNDPASLCGTIIENGWITSLSHAAYLGRELMRAKLSLDLGFTFTQDGA